MTTYVIGLGHIGLPTALLIAQDREVVGVDIDEDRVESLNRGELPFEEPGMEECFEEVGDRFAARIRLPDEAATETASGDTFVIATPTPLTQATQVADLSSVRQATETVASALSDGDLFVLESTVPPGTSARLVLPILRRGRSRDEAIRFAHCPERALPGDTIVEMVHNDRVIGVTDEESERAVRDVYQFVEAEMFETDPTTAEFVKLIENTFRDVNIALANEIATIAEQNGIDGRRAIELANEHPRVDILSPGPGVGGHCLPVDPRFLTQSVSDSRLIAVSRDINESMVNRTLRLVRGLVGDLRNPTVTVLGVAYKPDIGDTRETPARRFCQLAENEGYIVQVHDPHVEQFPYPLLSLEDALAGSDSVVILTDHSAFSGIDPVEAASHMETTTLVDTRGCVDDTRWHEAGFTVRTLGDGTWRTTEEVAIPASAPFVNYSGVGDDD